MTNGQTPTTPPPFLPGDREPGVWLWQRVYCGIMGAMTLLICVFGCIMVVGGMALIADDDPDAGFMVAMGIAYTAFGLLLTGAFLAGFVIPRKPWAWVYHLVLICLGLTGCCSLPFCIALLIFWLKPETQAFFGKLTITR